MASQSGAATTQRVEPRAPKLASTQLSAGGGAEGGRGRGAVLPRQARAREGKDQEDLSETFPSRLFVTSSDNDFQLLWNMTSL